MEKREVVLSVFKNEFGFIITQTANGVKMMYHLGDTVTITFAKLTKSVEIHGNGAHMRLDDRNKVGIIKLTHDGDKLSVDALYDGNKRVLKDSNSDIVCKIDLNEGLRLSLENTVEKYNSKVKQISVSAPIAKLFDIMNDVGTKREFLEEIVQYSIYKNFKASGVPYIGKKVNSISCNSDLFDKLKSIQDKVDKNGTIACEAILNYALNNGYEEYISPVHYQGF